MSAIITAIHILVCVILIVAVLLQSGKAADLAGAFGGGGSQTAFGPRGAATILSKITTASAVIFMLTSLGLWILSARGTRSVVSGEEPPKKETPASTIPETKKEAPATTPQKEEVKPPGEQTKAEPEKKGTEPEKKD